MTNRFYDKLKELQQWTETERENATDAYIEALDIFRDKINSLLEYEEGFDVPDKTDRELISMINGAKEEEEIKVICKNCQFEFNPESDFCCTECIYEDELKRANQYENTNQPNNK